MSRVSTKLKYKGEVGVCCGNFCDKETMIAELKAAGVGEFVKVLQANTMLSEPALQIIRIISEEMSTIK